MRWLLGLLAIAGCFTASPPSGVPCDPERPSCPQGQRCVARGGAFVCSTGDGDVVVDAAVADASDAAIDALPPGTIQKVYTASVAECIMPALPSPEACRMFNGNDQLVIDIRDSTTDEPWHSYMRFDLEDSLDGRKVTKVVLRLVSTDADNAAGPDTGSIFEVQPFTLATLSQMAPAKVGGQLAGSQGTLGELEVVQWPLPAELADGKDVVYLGLFPNDDDGVNYSNLDGPMPPRLIVEAQ